ncbi:MAG: DinB family protein [Algibacter sp.]|uniref:DinB family protein n=1 Tax=Algibacter sp. TaxID=1872428 RepID=UPI00261FBBDD|nr:DinB family protein [Algibacter sp.]MDG1729721.1 DinB family protein [Algibacter sp.]MDG2177875.1 DinB family protein [Algibacter sp.]
MNVSDLTTSEYDTYYGNYISKVSNEMTLAEGFKQGEQRVLNFFKSIPNDKLEYRYAPDKWSIKDVFQHVIDTEQIFMYRCFRIARHDKNPLAGFEQDDYIAPSKANDKSLDHLIEEYQAVRQNFKVLLKSLKDEDLKCMGTASGSPLSSRAAAFIILGHEIHHMAVIKERYL